MKPLLILLLFCYTSSFSVNIYGQVFCAGSQVPVINAKIMTKNVAGKRDICYTDSTGFFSIEVEPIMTILIASSNDTCLDESGTPMKKYFSSDRYDFNFSNEAKDTALTIDLELVPQNTGISLSIFFKKDSTAGKDLADQLKKIMIIFNDNPSIRKIEIVGYNSQSEDRSLRILQAREVFKHMYNLNFPLDTIVLSNSKPNRYKYLQTLTCDNKRNYAPPTSPLNQRVEVVITEISKD